jgi:hypothetical protein
MASIGLYRQASSEPDRSLRRIADAMMQYVRICEGKQAAFMAISVLARFEPCRFQNLGGLE